MRTINATPARRSIRPLRRLTGVVLVAGLAFAACGSDDDSSEPATTEAPAAPATDAASGDPSAPGVLESGATVDRYDQGDVIVHTYTNSEAGFGNTTAIIESENALVLIDSHFGEASASEFRDYAETLGKPIEQLLLTHEHPDHIGGVEPVFSDITTRASSGVIEAAAEAGTTIDEAVEAGEVTIDGIRYVYDIFVDAEAEEQLVIHLPDQGVLAPGDLVYNEYHAVMSPTFDNWLVILDELANRDGIELVLPGHGAPGGSEALADATEYLTTAQGIYDESADGETFSAAMVAAYPDRAGANLLEFGLGRLYPKAES